MTKVKCSNCEQISTIEEINKISEKEFGVFIQLSIEKIKKGKALSYICPVCKTNVLAMDFELQKDANCVKVYK
ncbi:MAG: hypothetical protein ACQEQF_07045 [Bacillota bacterium]